ncbi:DUF4436 domain-containing protein [Mycobacterium vicinigordonae]|uniref:DUF4436 domain-containing protein n=1 Tax=Mycobacterium vicinigordonae TaxID=1719132 RepID=A0A7D6E106_9MYCO|nr:DUF4436 domain-containing protein [Mycobacterium vicinigordonae]QLL08350.1 DUF4436 domain-containing protein [Mycobacterium vicinigordonae]
MSYQAPPPAPPPTQPSGPPTQPSGPPTQPSGPPTQPSGPPGPQPKSRGRRIAIDLAVVLAVVVVYVLSLFGVHLLATSAVGMEEPNLDTSDNTVVQVKLEELDTVNNRLKVSVLVKPQKSLINPKYYVLAQDVTVRMFPENDLGDLVYPVGKSPAQQTTYIDAEGDPANWPFDTYRSPKISAEVFAGTGDNRTVEDARVEITGSVGGWDVSLRRVQSPGDEDPRPDDVIITLQRSKSTLIFDIGIILVLISLPALALWVSIPMALGKKKFLPPFVSWFAAMLFAVVPLRTIFPGKPPEGSWIDQAITLWVLLALIVAMTLYILAYRKQSD